MSSSCVIGVLWGDEGKGKIIDYLARDAAFVARFGGGHNAGHTLVVEGQKLVLHLVPSGVLHPGVINVIGNGVVVDPEHLLSEVAELRERGIAVELGGNLLVSERCPVILPWHRDQDLWAEQARGSARIGTTGRGIGPAYADRASRSGLRLGELLDPDSLRVSVVRLLAEKRATLAGAGIDLPGAESMVEELLGYGALLAPAIADTGRVLREALASGQPILFEGAQGVLLDLEHGTYPFVTSSSTSTGGIASGTGTPPHTLDRVMAVAKAYSTRVGEGPFPAELHGEQGETLRAAGNEYGSTTGRPRRCGWFDAVASRYAVEVSGATELTVTNLDVLSGFDPLPLVVAYRTGTGATVDRFPAFGFAGLAPVLEELPGFQEDVTGVRRFEDLPANARAYVLAIEERVGVPVRMLSVGPGRDQVILR